MMALGETGLVRWVCGQNVVYGDELHRYIEHLRRPRPRGLVLLDVVIGASVPEVEHRRLVGSVVREVAAGGEIVGHVVVTDSAIARSVLAAINWFAAPPFPEVVAGSLAEGLAAAKAMSPAIDVDGVHAVLHAEAPWLSAVRW
jgi:hypothetical protein